MSWIGVIMFCTTSKQLFLEVATTLELILCVLLVACTGTLNASPAPPTSPTPAGSSTSFLKDSYSCTQSQPAPGKLSLAGLAYGPSHTGQDPTRGSLPSREEIEADMPTLASLTHSIRIYSSTGAADTIIQAARAAHICVALGLELGKNPIENAREITAGAHLASNRAVNAVIVGNEVLQRGYLSEKQLRSNIEQVHAKLGRAVPITVAETDTQWLQHRDLAKEVNVITVHIYPFWQGISIDSAIQYLDHAYTRVKQTFPDKQIVIGETGWPSAGSPYGASVPSAVNQARYLREFVNWAQAKGVQYFYFDAFDEDWKIHEKGVGTHWGLYQQNGQVKPTLSDMLPDPASATLIQRSYRDVHVGGLVPGFALGMDTSGHHRQWLTATHDSLLLTYPANQHWGVMFITVGPPVPPGRRPSLDLSAYRSLVVDLRAAVDGLCVRIGIKDNNQPDNGSESTVPRCLTTRWSTITLPLSLFTGADLTHLYIVFEVLFQGSSSTTLDVRNIRYSPT
jgi:exo-beta-1,3-glucanase (GH17 family)